MSNKERMIPPKPSRLFEVNDIVRLVRGWTPMTISNIDSRGFVTAYYGIHTFDPRGKHFPFISTAYYTRPRSEFAWWDGELVPGRNLPMARRFTVNNRSNMDVGILTGFTSTGFFILEFANNQVEVFTEGEITEIRPFSFNVRYMGGSTACFGFNDPNKRVNLNDILVSDAGDFCIVTKIDVGAKAPKNFNGRKLLTSEI